jgi:hypothetical protein
MICSFSRSSADPSKLIAKIHKWPKREPWNKLLLASPPLPPILRRHREHNEEAITTRGQGEGARPIQPRSFLLACPHCGQVKECLRIRLYTTRVRTIACNTCHRAIVSSKWSCPLPNPLAPMQRPSPHWSRVRRFESYW